MVEDNVLAYDKGLSQSMGGEFFEQEHITWFITGRRSLTRHNGGLRTLSTAENLAEIANPILNALRSRGLPFFWADYPPGATPGLGDFLTSHGISLMVKDMPAMTRSLRDLPALHIPDEVETLLVETEKGRFEWLEVLMKGFQEPEESRIDFHQYLEQTLTYSHTAWRHFLARWHGNPCAISTLLCAQQAAGIYHVTTLPEYRGRGLGRALTLAAMRHARQIGYTSAVLFATPDGYPLYQKLGFETVVTANLYAWNGS